MSFFSAIGDFLGFGGGDSEAAATSTTSTSVTVNPEINIANIVDLTPVERMLTHLVDVQQENVRSTLAVQAKAQDAIQAEIEIGRKALDDSASRNTALVLTSILAPLILSKG